MGKFTIEKNAFLKIRTKGYYSCYYRGYHKPGNPDYINTLKNTFNCEGMSELMQARKQVSDHICEAVPNIMKENGLDSCMLVCIPRAKELESYTETQLYFIRAVGDAAGKLNNVVDGTKCITRYIDTKTTHLPAQTGRVTRTGKESSNNGDAPYPGITRATCRIDDTLIKGKDIILVDDIYTKTCNVDEDCIQALYDAGANSVIFYAIAYTKRDI